MRSRALHAIVPLLLLVLAAGCKPGGPKGGGGGMSNPGGGGGFGPNLNGGGGGSGPGVRPPQGGGNGGGFGPGPGTGPGTNKEGQGPGVRPGTKSPAAKKATTKKPATKKGANTHAQKTTKKSTKDLADGDIADESPAERKLAQLPAPGGKKGIQTANDDKSSGQESPGDEVKGAEIGGGVGTLAPVLGRFDDKNEHSLDAFHASHKLDPEAEPAEIGPPLSAGSSCQKEVRKDALTHGHGGSAGSHTHEFTNSAGLNQDYEAVVPSGNPSKPRGVLMLLAGDTGITDAELSAYKEMADESGKILFIPTPYNIHSTSKNPTWWQGEGQLEYLKGALKDLTARYNINQDDFDTVSWSGGAVAMNGEIGSYLSSRVQGNQFVVCGMDNPKPGNDKDALPGFRRVFLNVKGDYVNNMDLVASSEQAAARYRLKGEPVSQKFLEPKDPNDPHCNPEQPIPEIIAAQLKAREAICGTEQQGLAANSLQAHSSRASSSLATH